MREKRGKKGKKNFLLDFQFIIISWKNTLLRFKVIKKPTRMQKKVSMLKVSL